MIVDDDILSAGNILPSFAIESRRAITLLLLLLSVGDFLQPNSVTLANLFDLLEMRFHRHLRHQRVLLAALSIDSKRTTATGC